MNIKPPSGAALGWGAALLSVAIGAGWQLATRAGARSTLAPIDLALLRYTIPALLLAPLWWRIGLRPATVGRWQLLAIVAGAGLPFGLLVMAGASMAPVAHMGALLPGLSPLLVALLSVVLFGGARPGARPSIGLVLVGAGLVLITLPSWSGLVGTAWAGDLLIAAGAVLWALYTLALRRGGIDPWQAAAVVSAWSALGVVPLWLVASACGKSLLLAAPLADVATQFVWQGLVAGIAGLAVFGVAVQRIGAASASSVGALVPPLVAVGGWALLGEALGPAAWAGVVAVTLGVLLAGRKPAQKM